MAPIIVQSVGPVRAAHLFEKAASALKIRGWAKGRVFEIDGSMCAQGAMICAVTDDLKIDDERWHTYYEGRKDYTDLFRALDSMFERATGYSVPMFNDHVAQTVEDVIRELLFVADQIKTHGQVLDVGVKALPLKFSASSITVKWSKKKSNEYVQDVLNQAAAKKAEAQGTQTDHELAAGPGS